MVDDDSLDSQVKAKLDDSELSDDLPKALQKVDLDLDDAPFLEDEPEEAAPEPEPEAPPLDEPAPEEAKPASKKRLILIVAALVLLLAAGGAAFFLLRKKPPPPLVKEPEPPAPVQEAPVPPPMPPEPPPMPPKPKEERIVKLAPFLVDVTDAQGHTHFLNIRFAAATYEASAELEFKRNRIVVRDAVYYYLKNKPLEFYTDKNNADVIKKDVLSVINQFVGAQPLDNLLIEDLLVR